MSLSIGTTTSIQCARACTFSPHTGFNLLKTFVHKVMQHNIVRLQFQKAIRVVCVTKIVLPLDHYRHHRVKGVSKSKNKTRED